MASPAVHSAVLPPPVGPPNLNDPRSVWEPNLCPDASLSREALGFLHHYLATNIHSEPRGSKLAFMRLYQDYQRFSKQNSQRSIFPAKT